MQLKDQEEQNLIRTSSQLNIPIQPEETTENTATNPTFKAQPSLNKLSRGIKALLILLILFSTLTLMGLGALFAFSIFDFFYPGSSDPCGEMQSENTIQSR
jgi:hypothetical protein